MAEHLASSRTSAWLMMKRVWVAQGLMPQPRCRRISVMYCRSITAKLNPKRLSISPFHCSTTEGGATTTTPDAPSGAAAARGRSSSSRAQQQLAHDQPGLDRLAQAHVVGDEQAHPGHPQRLKRCWIDHPDREEEITRLEDELLAAMESFLERIDAIDLQLREAQEEQEAQVELERAVIAAAGAEAVRPSTAP